MQHSGRRELKYLTPACGSGWLRLKQGTGYGGEAFKAGPGAPPASVGHRGSGAGWNSLDAMCRVACGEAREMPLVWARVEEVVVVRARRCEGDIIYRVTCPMETVRTKGPRDLLPAAEGRTLSPCLVVSGRHDLGSPAGMDGIYLFAFMPVVDVG